LIEGVFEDEDIEQEDAHAEQETIDATKKNFGNEQESAEATKEIAGNMLCDSPGEELSADVTEEALGIAPENEGIAESLPTAPRWCQTVPSTLSGRRECGELSSRAAGGTR